MPRRREIVTNGKFVRIHPEASDEGVWIETRMGERLLTGEPFKNDDTICDFYLEGFWGTAPLRKMLITFAQRGTRSRQTALHPEATLL